MQFLPENTDDIIRYYKNTYIKFKETGDTLFYVRAVREQRVEGTSQDGTPFELYLDAEFPYEVDYVLPHKSYFQWGDHACLLQRIPAKQYQRGISANNVSLSLLRAGGQGADTSVGFEVLMSFVSKQAFMSLDTAIESDKISVVLSPRMAFIPSTKKIYLDSKCVGQLTPKRKLVKCFFGIFRPEFEALVQDTQYKVVT